MILDFPLKVKGVTEAGSFTGFAAIYGVKDLQDDIIERGAFRQAVNSQPAGGYVLLWSHKQDTPIGTAAIEDSPSALIVKGQFDLDDADGVRAYSRAKKGIVRGLSIGYLPPDPAKVSFRDGARILKEIELAELSLVSIPAQRDARVTNVKNLSDVQNVLHGLDADRLAPEMLSELRQISLSLKTLLEKDGEQARDAGLLRELRALAAELK